MVDELTITVAIIGVIIGSISLIRQFWKERPRLVFTIENKYYYPPEKSFNSLIYTIFIALRIENKGENDTTIHTASISFDYDNKPYFLKNELFSDNIIKAGDTKRFNLNFTIRQEEIKIEHDVINSTLIIEDTHKSKKIPISIIGILPPRKY